MKLWLKISLIAIIIVTLSTSICSLLMLLRFGQSNLDLAINNTLTNQQLCTISWITAMESDATNGDSEIVQRSLARHLISNFADNNTILLSGNDFIYNTTSINPQDFLPLKTNQQESRQNSQQYIVQDINGQSMLITGSTIQVNNFPYKLYVINDISAVYTGIENLAYQFVFINMVVIIISFFIIIVLVRVVVHPIAKLKQNTSLIASGVYDKRIEILKQDEIGELALDFNSMISAVEAHVTELRQEATSRNMLMSALTHELKTPMTSISGNAQTLLHTKMDDEEREEALSCIVAECTRVELLSQKLMQLIVLHQNDSINFKDRSISDL